MVVPCFSSFRQVHYVHILGVRLELFNSSLTPNDLIMVEGVL